MAKPKKTSVKQRIRDFFLANIGTVVTREQIQNAAQNPDTGKIPENWHQRVSELRVDEGYNILSWRDREFLKPGQYLLESAAKRKTVRKRQTLNKKQRDELFQRDNYQCRWPGCTLKLGDIDPVGGGKVVLSADHLKPHSMSGDEVMELSDWQTLCSRHQVEKKNFYDDKTKKLNLRELVRQASKKVKKEIFEDLKKYFSS